MLQKAIKVPEGVALGIVAAPVFALERSAEFAKSLLTATTIKVELKLVSPIKYSPRATNKRLAFLTDVKAKAMPEAVFNRSK